MKIYIAPINDQAKAPERIEHSVGYDIFAYGNHIINVNETKIVPCGFHMALPEGYGAFIWDRSSFGAKGIHIFRQMPTNPSESFLITPFGGVMDWSYRGQMGVILRNMSNNIFQVKHQDKIAQFVIQKCEIFDQEIVSLEELLAIPSERGQQGLGSSDGNVDSQNMISKAMSADEIFRMKKP